MEPTSKTNEKSMKETAKPLARDHNPYTNIKLCKAVIPKGTEYHADANYKEHLAAKTIVVRNPYKTPVWNTISFSELANCLLLYSVKRNSRNYTLITSNAVRLVAREITFTFDNTDYYLDYNDIVGFANKYKGEIKKYEYRYGRTVEILVNHYTGLQKELKAQISQTPIFKAATELIEKTF